MLGQAVFIFNLALQHQTTDSKFASEMMKVVLALVSVISFAACIPMAPLDELAPAVNQDLGLCCLPFPRELQLLRNFLFS